MTDWHQLDNNNSSNDNNNNNKKKKKKKKKKKNNNNNNNNNTGLMKLSLLKRTSHLAMSFHLVACERKFILKYSFRTTCKMSSSACRFSLLSLK